MEMIKSFLNNALYVTILVIMVSSLVSFYVRTKARDRCLRDLNGCQATIESKNGDIAWGNLHVYSSGIELLYASTYNDKQGHVENSYILYANDLSNLQAIYRIHDHLSERNRCRREREIRCTYQPGIFRRLVRMLRNTLCAFKDAIGQTIDAILGARAAKLPENTLLTKHEELATSSVQFISGALGNAYEPILERYIGQYVVLDILRGEQTEEEHGILKEYSANYIELLNAKIEVPLPVYLQGQPPSTPPPVHVERVGDVLRVTHELDRTVMVEAVWYGDSSRELDVPVAPGQSVDVELLEEEAQEAASPVELEFSVRCLADLIVPRTVAVVRHAGLREKLTWQTLLDLDEFVELPWIKRMIGGKEIRRIEQ
jgi:hypothetical protein